VTCSNVSVDVIIKVDIERLVLEVGIDAITEVTCYLLVYNIYTLKKIKIKIKRAFLSLLEIYIC
jgi:hypothetical protein